MILDQPQRVTCREGEKGRFPVGEKVLRFAQRGIEQPLVADACRTAERRERLFVGQQRVAWVNNSLALAQVTFHVVEELLIRGTPQPGHAAFLLEEDLARVPYHGGLGFEPVNAFAQRDEPQPNPLPH
jgi:hypothetical protein